MPRWKSSASIAAGSSVCLKRRRHLHQAALPHLSAFPIIRTNQAAIEKLHEESEIKFNNIPLIADLNKIKNAFEEIKPKFEELSKNFAAEVKHVEDVWQQERIVTEVKHVEDT